MDTNENKGSITSQSGSSFLIRIQYRQNSSWQGLIQWLDGRKTRHFRSFLEMVMLMQEALAYSDTTAEKVKLQNWNDREEVS